MLFSYCMILSAIFFVLSGMLKESKLSEPVMIGSLLAIFVLSLLPEWNIRYFVQVNWGWAGTLLLCLCMFFGMKGERGESVLYVCAVGLLLWAAGEYVPFFNQWAVRAFSCIVLSLLLASSYRQASFLAVWGYAIAHGLCSIMLQDLELALFTFGAPEDFSGLILCLVIPMMVRSLYTLRQRKGAGKIHGKPA